MFKFDGVAGNPTELAMEMEAMLRTLAQLRNQKSQKDDEDWGKNERTGNRRNMTPSGVICCPVVYGRLTCTSLAGRLW